MSDTGGFTPEPMPTLGVTGTYSLGPDFQFGDRPVTPAATALAGTSGLYDKKYFVNKQGKTYYRGPALVDGSGLIARDPYDTTNLRGEAYRYLASLDVGTRKARLNELYDRGLFDNGRPSSTGLMSNDLQAAEQYLLYLNQKGVTDDVGIAFLRQEFPGGQAASGRTIRVTSKADIDKVVRDESFRLLGRPLTAQEARDAVSFIQMRERQSAGGAEQATTLGTLAEQAVGRGRQDEVQVEGFRTLADLLEQALGGG